MVSIVLVKQRTRTPALGRRGIERHTRDAEGILGTVYCGNCPFSRK